MFATFQFRIVVMPSYLKFKDMTLKVMQCRLYFNYVPKGLLNPLPISRHKEQTYTNGFTFMWPCIVTNFFLIKPTDALISKNLFLSRNSTCFEQFLCPSSGVFHCTFGTGTCHQTCMTCTSAEGTVENSWWLAEELPETCRVSWQK